MDDSGSRGEKSFEEEEIRKQIEVLATEIELRFVSPKSLYLFLVYPNIVVSTAKLK